MKKDEAQIIIVEEAKQLPPEVVSDLQANFNPLFQQAQEWKKKAEGLTVKDASETEKMEKAREARLELKRIRVEADKVRAKLKEESLLKGKAIDGMFNIIKFLVKPIEDHLEEQEKFIEIQEQKKLDEQYEKRVAELSKYVEDPSIYMVRSMTDEAFNALLDQSKKLHQIKLDEEKKIEEERIAREKAEKEEQEKIRLENERLKKEAEEREKKLAAERKIQEEKEAKERAEREAKEKKEREANEARLKAEREAREKAEAELKAKQEAEAKAKRDAEEKLKQQEAEAKRIEDEKKKAPDKVKLKALAGQLLSIDYPEVQSEEAKKVLAGVKELMQKVNIYIVKNVENL